MMEAKICGIKDSKTLNFIINHKNSPKYIGFICNYKKSKRYINFYNLKKLLNVDKKNVNFVAVLVSPKNNILEKIKELNFDYYQLYDVNPKITKKIKYKYNKKIITAISVENKTDVKKYKSYIEISDIILFDSKGYEKSVAFDHSLLSKIPNSITKMVAGNIQYYEKLDKFKKIADIVDISGSLETNGKKDLKKINIFLNNLKKLNDKIKKKDSSY